MTKNRLIVLGLLEERPMHGYQIDQEIKRRHMNIWAKVNTASIYNTLVTLRKEGLIRVSREKKGNMPERKVYHITEKGKSRLSGLVGDGLSKFVLYNQSVFLLSVGFIRSLDRQEAVRALEKRHKEIDSIKDSVIKQHGDLRDRIPYNWYYIIDNSIEHLKMEIALTVSLIGRIKQNEPE
ncbi:MAG: PadR family transcriptional regulator [Elusimicrobia bacterium]|nr:PadR family transcriptional regulator [Elusimicrobiota bacterium]